MNDERMLKTMENNEEFDSIECCLSTKDNPFNPFTDFDKWFAYDEAKGYHTCSYLARIARTSDVFSDEMNNKEINRAIDEIINMNATGLEYIKIPKPI